jgi:hypothetical protein
MAHLTTDDKKLLGNVIVKQIRSRTRAGKGVTSKGRQYNLSERPYTENYARQKGVGRGAVDLTLSGRMLENMYVKDVGKKDVTLSVRKADYGKLRGAEEGIPVRERDLNGKIIKSKGRMRKVKRPFFHLSNQDRKAILQDEVFQRTMKRAQKRLEDKR